jgi:hypothetical protein
MRQFLTFSVATVCALMLAAAASASPTNLITNGDFETGTFAGWSATTTLASPLCAWQFSTCGWFDFVTPAADGGSFFADNGFDGSGPGTYTLEQTVTIPSGASATLSWEDYVEASYYGVDRTIDVVVKDASGTSTLATPYTYTAPPSSFVDTGWVQHSVDLSTFVGQTVQIAFVETVPEYFTGPAEYDIDNVSLLASAGSSGARVGYCSAAGDTWADGSPMATGTFLNLFQGQPDADAHYAGATQAVFVQGEGLTCNPPSGYTSNGMATSEMGAGGDLYHYFTAP